MFCVATAMRAASAVGVENTSSYESVCSDCRPPKMPAIACVVTRAMLFSACWRVRSTPEVWPWNLKRHERGSRAPRRSRQSLAQMRRPARNLATSSKKLTEMSKKKVKRGRKRSGSMPRAMQSSAYCTAEASVKAIASAGVAPACCMCWPTMDSGFQPGTCSLQNAMWSTAMRRAPCSAMRKNMWLATKCEMQSLWFEVPVILVHGTPRRRATASSKASSVKGDGSFIAVDSSPMGTPSSARSMSPTWLMTVPQVPSSSTGTSSAS